MRTRIDTKPTRLNLLRSRRRLTRVREGADLLRRKREALVRELLGLARPAVDARERIARAAGVAYPALIEALAEEGRAGVLAAADPLRELEVTTTTARMWGLTLATVAEAPRLERTLEARGTAPGPTAAATVEAADAFETLAQLLLDAAPKEMLLRELGRAVSKTSRQVRALELRVEPDLASAVAHVTTLLDEREREEQTRLRHFLRRWRAPPGKDRRGMTETRRYEGVGIAVLYDAKRCIHAAECVRGLPAVFDTGRRRWVDPAAAAPARVAEVVMRCPTGALAFERLDGGAEEPTPARNMVTVVPDGPLHLRGELEIETADGIVHATRASLCRCGASANKPFCDGSHTDVGFRHDGGFQLGTPIAPPASQSDGPLRVRASRRGPILIDGVVEVRSADLGTFARMQHPALCRCGHSGRKPFCDGTHHDVPGFDRG